MNCLHCTGTGVEPFSDEDCTVCLGEGDVPAEMNREYYDRIQESLDDGSK